MNAFDTLYALAKAADRQVSNGGFRIPCPAHGGDDDNLKVDLKGTMVVVDCKSRDCPQDAIVAGIEREYGISIRRKRQSARFEPLAITRTEYRRGDSSETRISERTDWDGPCGNGRCKETGIHKHIVESPKGGKTMGWLVRFYGPVGSLTIDPPMGETIVLCEGEKAAAVVAKAGHWAASWIGGAKRVGKADFGSLRGMRVVLWPDNDEEGFKAMTKACSLSWRADAASVEIVKNPEGSVKGADAADLTIEAIAQVLLSPEPFLYGMGNRAKNVKDTLSTQGATIGPAYDCDESGNAWRFLSSYSEKLLLVEREGDYSDVCVVHDDSGLWQNAPDILLELYDESCREWQRKANDALKDELIGAQESNALIRWLAKERSQRRCESTLKHCGAAARQMASRGDEREKRITYTNDHEFDQANGHIVVGNGLVDLATGKLVKADEAKAIFARQRTRMPNYNPKAKHWAVDALFAHLHPERAAYLKACLGRAMWGQPDRMFITLVGEKGSGKSTLFAAIRAALGKGGYAEGISEDSLRPSRGSNKSGPTEERRVLVESRFALAEEAGDWRISWERLKMFTGGSPETTYQPKYGTERTMPVTATILLSANRMPQLGLVDDAMVDRFRAVLYTAPEKSDPSVKNAFAPHTAEPGAIEAMLALLISLAVENPPGREIPIPEQVKADMADVIEAETSEFQSWLKATVKRTGRKADKLIPAQIWTAWCWYVDEMEDAESVGGQRRDKVTAEFKRIMGETGMSNMRVNGKQGKGWTGYKLGDVEPEMELGWGVCRYCGQPAVYRKGNVCQTASEGRNCLG